MGQTNVIRHYIKIFAGRSIFLLYILIVLTNDPKSPKVLNYCNRTYHTKVTKLNQMAFTRQINIFKKPLSIVLVFCELLLQLSSHSATFPYHCANFCRLRIFWFSMYEKVILCFHIYCSRMMVSLNQ